jgi:hypothetical protein
MLLLPRPSLLHPRISVEMIPTLVSLRKNRPTTLLLRVKSRLPCVPSSTSLSSPPTDAHGCLQEAANAAVAATAVGEAASAASVKAEEARLAAITVSVGGAVSIARKW